MDQLDLVKLHPLMEITQGRNEISIAVIDGPLDFKHTALKDAKIRTSSDFQLNQCKNASSAACIHGTFVIGILSASRDSAAPAICPRCEVILRPIFNDTSLNSNYTIDRYFPTTTPKELAKAIIECVNAGAKIINLSIGILSSSLITYHELQQAYNYALQKNVIIVAASGNQGTLGYGSNLYHPWIIKVAACDENGVISPISNLGRYVTTKGVMAPGINIQSTIPNNGYSQMSGTSFSVPFVTGAIALLWSIFRNATSTDIISAIIETALDSKHISRSVIPPLLDASLAYKKLEKFFQ
jgi:subtilisin family serine protease